MAPLHCFPGHLQGKGIPTATKRKAERNDRGRNVGTGAEERILVFNLGRLGRCV